MYYMINLSSIYSRKKTKGKIRNLLSLINAEQMALGGLENRMAAERSKEANSITFNRLNPP